MAEIFGCVHMSAMGGIRSEGVTVDDHFTDAQKYLYLLGRSATRGSEYINASFVNVSEATCASCLHVIHTCSHVLTMLVYVNSYR